MARQPFDLAVEAFKFRVRSAQNALDSAGCKAALVRIVQAAESLGAVTDGGRARARPLERKLTRVKHAFSRKCVR